MANVDYDCDEKVFVWPDGSWCKSAQLDGPPWWQEGYTEMTMGEYRNGRKVEAEKPDHW